MKYFQTGMAVGLYRFLPIAPSIIASSKIHSTALERKSHYDVLGITPKASQSEIKKAYYRLSMKYHPDQHKNPSPEISQKFIELTESYETLYDQDRRRKYDDEIEFFRAFTHPDPLKDDFKFMRRKAGKSFYDFDTWTRAHYSNTFERQRATKHKASQPEFNDDEEGSSKDKMNHLNLQMFLSLFVSIVILFLLAELKFSDDHGERLVYKKDKPVQYGKDRREF